LWGHKIQSEDLVDYGWLWLTKSKWSSDIFGASVHISSWFPAISLASFEGRGWKFVIELQAQRWPGCVTWTRERACQPVMVATNSWIDGVYSFYSTTHKKWWLGGAYYCFTNISYDLLLLLHVRLNEHGRIHLNASIVSKHSHSWYLEISLDFGAIAKIVNEASCSNWWPPAVDVYSPLCQNFFSRGFTHIRIPFGGCLPSGYLSYIAMERSTMLLIGKSSINSLDSFKEKSTGNHCFLPSNIGFSCKFSHHPILW